MTALTLLDTSLFLVSAAQWERGLGFVRPSWLPWLLGVALGSLLLNALLCKRGAPAWSHGALAFPALCFAFLAAGSGNPYVSWQKLPIFSLFGDSLYVFLSPNGFLLAGLGAVAHVVLAESARAGSVPRARWGAALVLTSLAAALPPVLILVDGSNGGHVDPRASSEAAIRSYELLRYGLLFALLSVGLGLIASSFGRRR